MSEDQTTTAQWLRAAAERIATGSSRICLVCARQLAQRLLAKGRSWKDGVSGWLGEAEGLNWAFRVALLVGGALILRKVGGGIIVSLGHALQSPTARWLLWPAAAVWVIAAYRIGHPDWEPKAPPAPAPAADPVVDDVAQPEETPLPEPPVAPPGPSLRDLHDALARLGTPHAHIAVLAEDLDTTPERVRETLLAAGIPAEPVRMRGRGSSTGVRGGSIPSPLGSPEGAPGGVVAAGQPANNNDNNGDAPGFRIEQDPANPVRHHVRHAA